MNDTQILERLAAIETRLDALPVIVEELRHLHREIYKSAVVHGHIEERLTSCEEALKENAARRWQLSLAAYGALLAAIGSLAVAVLVG